MSWDDTWEEFYKTSGGNGYPEAAVVRLIARNFYNTKKRFEKRILDLGCGSGANLWYLSREGFSAFGIDGSKTAIERTEKKLFKEGLNANLLTGDFKKLPYDTNFFDAVLDITSIQHNDYSTMKQIVNEVHRVMKTNGTYLGLMINSDKNLSANSFVTNYLDDNEVKKLFENFKNIEINESLYTEDHGRKYIKFLHINAIK